MRELLRQRRGETLVEVMCAFLLLLTALGGLLGAARFSGGVLRRTQTEAQQMERLRQELGEQEGLPTGGYIELDFTTYSPDGPDHGEESLFTVTASLETKDAAYQAEDGEMTTVTFRLFACPEEGAVP